MRERERIVQQLRQMGVTPTLIDATAEHIIAARRRAPSNASDRSWRNGLCAGAIACGVVVNLVWLLIVWTFYWSN